MPDVFEDIDADIGKKDITHEQYEFIKDYLNKLEYDDYDKLIILCDSLTDANGFCRILKIVYMYKVGAESVSAFYI